MASFRSDHLAAPSWVAKLLGTFTTTGSAKSYPSTTDAAAGAASAAPPPSTTSASPAESAVCGACADRGNRVGVEVPGDTCPQKSSSSLSWTGLIDERHGFTAGPIHRNSSTARSFAATRTSALPFSNNTASAFFPSSGFTLTTGTPKAFSTAHAAAAAPWATFGCLEAKPGMSPGSTASDPSNTSTSVRHTSTDAVLVATLEELKHFLISPATKLAPNSGVTGPTSM
mmetsp:Transcript_8130/g.24016  ORF Transcript_8130/g.24016 Transcript_8130/m.24016 type:complete len:228 (+) Transcript_8130:5086-5769(+)